MGFFTRVIANGVAIWLATQLLSGLTIVGGTSTGEKVGIVLLIGLVFGLINAIVKPVVKFFALPLYILTLGLFTIVVNALMLWLTAWLTDGQTWGLRIDNFGTAVVGALIISVVSFILSAVFSGSRKRGR